MNDWFKNGRQGVEQLRTALEWRKKCEEMYSRAKVEQVPLVHWTGWIKAKVRQSLPMNRTIGVCRINIYLVLDSFVRSIYLDLRKDNRRMQYQILAYCIKRHHLYPSSKRVFIISLEEDMDRRSCTEWFSSDIVKTKKLRRESVSWRSRRVLRVQRNTT